MGHKLDLKELLQKTGLKCTPIRLTVLEVLAHSPHALSQPDIESALKNQKNRVTIYRILRDLEEKGLIHRVFDVSGTSRFAVCADHCTTHAHHDEHLHFNCTVCQNVFCLDTISMPKMNLPEGFKVANFHFSATGVCQKCQPLP